VVGDYSGFIGESIQMYFDVISEGTLCEGAKVNIERVKPKLQCSQCGTYFERKPFSFACPACGGEGRPTEIGKEFYIDSIEVET
jgi:hydrogenase nickel incorporation protein HypA/HybF